MLDGCFLREEPVHIHKVALGSGWSIPYPLKLSVIFLCSKAKKQKWKMADVHFLCEQLFLSDWGLALEHEKKRGEASHLWWWIFLGGGEVGFFCFNLF